MYAMMYTRAMPRMIRKQVYLRESDQAYLVSTSHREGKTEAEVMRAALERAAHSSPEPLLVPEAWERARAVMRARGTLSSARPATWSRDELHGRGQSSIDPTGVEDQMRP